MEYLEFLLLPVQPEVDKESLMGKGTERRGGGRQRKRERERESGRKRKRERVGREGERKRERGDLCVDSLSYLHPSM